MNNLLNIKTPAQAEARELKAEFGLKAHRADKSPSGLLEPAA